MLLNLTGFVLITLLMNYVFVVFESVPSGLRKLGSFLLFIIIKDWRWPKRPSIRDWLNFEYLQDGMPGRHLQGIDRMIGGYILTWKEVQIYS